MSEIFLIKVTAEHLEPREFFVKSDSKRSLAEELTANDLPLNTRCGQRGLCRGCEVVIEDGILSGSEGTVSAPAVAKACQMRAAGNLSIRIPARSLIEHRPQVGQTFEIAVPYAHQPLVASQPGQRDTGFAVDIGTTTVVVLLVDLTNGEVLSRAGDFNAQIRFGDNVITRIELARHSDNLAAMQRAVVMETLRPLLEKACERAGRGLDRIAGGAIAGNTTMLHLLVGEDPTPLGIAPFIPGFLEARQVTATEILLIAEGLAPDTPIQLLPGIAAYLGADITAGVFASGMAYDTAPGLLVDMGTNGEIVLQANGKLTACATAAGPAFEGCGLRCGTRARDGAVSDIRLALDPFHLDLATIGELPVARATGLCGSAYIDFMATARDSGLLRDNGRFDSAAWENLPAGHRLNDDDQRAFGLTGNPDSPLRITEADIALLLQAKAAIGAGIEILLESANLRASDLGHVYLAGGFGMHLDVAHAIAIGLLPGCRPEQVRVVGNTALAGALLALVDRNTLDEMSNLGSQIEVIELNLAEGFEDRYIDHLALP
jgi:uncharacterized 2Fe-2S/4Fe-4S cluster protein (DUF4445 family)